MLTKRQENRARRMRELGYTPEMVARILDVEASLVRQLKIERRTRADESLPERLLASALERPAGEERYRAVRSVLGCFGPELGRTLADAEELAGEKQNHHTKHMEGQSC